MFLNFCLKEVLYHMIRLFQQEDTAAIVELMHQLGYKVSLTDLETRIEHILLNKDLILVKIHQNKVVGCINAIKDARLAEGIRGEIVSLVVSEACRGQGFGHELVKAAEDWIYQFSDTVRIRCNVIRDKAHKFYLEQGYACVKNQKVFEKTQ